MNPEVTRHPMYNTSSVPEYARVSFTRLRLSSHYLRVETGRWARLTREQRVCRCDKMSVQDEAHILLHCPITTPVRAKFPEFAQINSCYELFCHENVNAIALYRHQCLLAATDK